MSAHVIEVVPAPHVRAWYHVLAHFDLQRDPASCPNPTYVKTIAAARPNTVASPARSFGSFHRRFRKARGRAILGILPAAFTDPEVFDATCESLIEGRGAPSRVPPLVRRLIAPLATEAGGRLVGLTARLIAEERDGFLDGHYRSLPEPAPGLQSYLTERLVPLVPVLYGATPQRITVFAAEALSLRSFHVTPARGRHHVAIPATLHNAFFHALYALVRHRTDRLIRPFVPSEIKADPAHPMNAQVRVDAGMTTTFHLLLRHRTDEVEPFREWAEVQFAMGDRQPQAAVAALHPMNLLPDDAIPAVRTLLGDEVE